MLSYAQMGVPVVDDSMVVAFLFLFVKVHTCIMHFIKYHKVGLIASVVYFFVADFSPIVVLCEKHPVSFTCTQQSKTH